MKYLILLSIYCFPLFAGEVTVFCMCMMDNNQKKTRKLLRFEISNETGKVINEKKLGFYPDLTTCIDASNQTEACKK